MNNNQHILHQLYDYVNNDVSLHDRSAIEHHLSLCSRCAHELKLLGHTLESIIPPEYSPASQRSEEFWHFFPIVVAERIGYSKPLSIRARFQNLVAEMFPGHRWKVGLAGFIVCIVVGIIGANVMLNDSRHMSSTLEMVHDDMLPLENVDLRARQYFRRSGALLVELANMRLMDEGYPDLAIERKVSRGLINEARFLRQQPLTPYTAKLVSDIEPVLLELANSKPHSDEPIVELIRDGIEQGNLLFKVRMAQVAYDSSSPMRVHYVQWKD